MTDRPSPRIRTIEDPPEETRAILAKGLTWDGRPLNMPATLAHHPRLLKRFTVFAGAFLSRSVLPDRDRELLTLRAAARFDSEYYFGHHVVMFAVNTRNARSIGASTVSCFLMLTLLMMAPARRLA